ncbi:hypothetical protein NPIL_248821 [Nephila pilipes]|uniref:Uncharacterized protein n=1 Tax=Nephila pilipes TaxID=299642 RepID=A0A8X6U6N0_NEPPI|nr:hypothetical protein NPIL_248821 [Nephila pilipes]
MAESRQRWSYALLLVQGPPQNNRAWILQPGGYRVHLPRLATDIVTSTTDNDDQVSSTTDNDDQVTSTTDNDDQVTSTTDNDDQVTSTMDIDDEVSSTQEN